MNKNQLTKEKVCAFYASDYHFEMVTLPYINKKIENSEEVIILTENNLEDSIKTLLSRMNLKESKNERIFELNWKNRDIEKLEKIKQNVDEQKDTTIFIKGKESYINNMNKNIEKDILNNDKIKIINCYSIEEIGENVNNIMSKYKKVLSMTGEKEI